MRLKIGIHLIINSMYISACCASLPVVPTNQLQLLNSVFVSHKHTVSQLIDREGGTARSLVN